jgi:hypothetical protein
VGYKVRLALMMLLLSVAALSKGLQAQERNQNTCLQISSFTNLGEAALETIEPIVAAMYRRAGYCTKFLRMHSRRSAQLLAAGQIDGELVRTAIGARSVSAFSAMVPQPLFEVEFQFLWLEDTVFDGTLKNLEGLNVGLLAGQVTTENLLQGYTSDITRLNSLSNAANLLIRGRIDVLASDAVSPNEVLKSLSKANAQTRTSIFHTAEVFHIVAKKHTALTPGLSAALAKMIRNGELEISSSNSAYKPANIIKNSSFTCP